MTGQGKREFVALRLDEVIHELETDHCRRAYQIARQYPQITSSWEQQGGNEPHNIEYQGYTGDMEEPPRDSMLGYRGSHLLHGCCRYGSARRTDRGYRADAGIPSSLGSRQIGNDQSWSGSTLGALQCGRRRPSRWHHLAVWGMVDHMPLMTDVDPLGVDGFATHHMTLEEALMHTIHKLFGYTEKATALDGTSNSLRDGLRRVLSNSAMDRVLRGDWLGHPLHPALVALPIGTWIAATVFDTFTDDAAAPRRLLGLGLLSLGGVLTTGWADWSVGDERQRRVGLIHAAANGTAATLILASYVRRCDGEVPDTLTKSLSAGALPLVGVGGALGGHLAYVLGSGMSPEVT